MDDVVQATASPVRYNYSSPCTRLWYAVLRRYHCRWAGFGGGGIAWHCEVLLGGVCSLALFEYYSFTCAAALRDVVAEPPSN